MGLKMDTKKIIMAACVGVIIISFFLPWITVESEAIGGITKLITGKGQGVIDSISGFDVPVLANSTESRFMISVIKIFNPNIKNADKKSYLICLIPLLSVGMFAAFYFLKDNKWVALTIAIVGCLIFLVATIKLTTTDLDKMVLKVNIAFGLWLLLFGYLAIGILQAIEFVQMLKKK